MILSRELSTIERMRAIMAATERMREYAIMIACTLGLPFPNYLSWDETHAFIDAHEAEYKAVPSRIKKEKMPEANSWIYAVFDLLESKLRFYIGQWLGNVFSKKIPPFDSVDNLNKADRFELAKMFWAYKIEDAFGWKHLKYFNGKPITHDELIPIIARDLDYRIPKAAANYIFKRQINRQLRLPLIQVLPHTIQSGCNLKKHITAFIKSPIHMSMENQSIVILSVVMRSSGVGCWSGRVMSK